MDFTISKYKDLLEAIVKAGYQFQTFSEFLQSPLPKSIVLRHDVDKLPKNSLRFAKLQHEYQIKGSYYFRMVKQSFNEEIIKEIAELGHEIGYHYEDLTIAKGDKEKAFSNFLKNLEIFRKFYPVKTICMHGSPLSKWDSKTIWDNYNYKELGIIGEPYFDIDFSKVLYLTDTGRRWNGEKYSVRDKTNLINSLSKRYNAKTSSELIRLFQTPNFENQIMLTFHPQRWNSNMILWTKELLFQKIKNLIKRVLYVK